MMPEYGEGKMWLTFCHLAAISTRLHTSGYILIHQLYAQTNMGYRLQPSVIYRGYVKIENLSKLKGYPSDCCIWMY